MTLWPRGDPVYRSSYERDVSLVVIATVATVIGRSSTEIGPLSEVGDPEALDEVFAPTFDDRPRAGGTIRFPFEGLLVVVDARRREVRAYERDDRR